MDEREIKAIEELAENIDSLRRKLNSLPSELDRGNLIRTINDGVSDVKRVFNDHTARFSQDAYNMTIINSRIMLEQALANATQQFISIKIALGNGSLEKEDAVQLLKMSKDNLGNCFIKSPLRGAEIEAYRPRVKSVMKKHEALISALDNTSEQD